MLCKTIDIHVDYAAYHLEQDGYQPRLCTYLASDSTGAEVKRKRPAVIVCPGGSYRFTSEREAEPVALEFNVRGYQAFVLYYSVAPSRFPCALYELATAVAYVRSHAEEWGIDENRILVCGFSAGGHLTASLGVFWNSDFLKRDLGFTAEHRPNGLILSYPVISSGPMGHQESFENLRGGRLEERRELVSLEKQVNGDVPPCFLWHTDTDELVPVENSLLFAMALKAHHLPMELHIYPRGGHGLSLGNEMTRCERYANEPVVQNWIEMAARFGMMDFIK